jgi:hypothetical protein
MDNRQQRTVQTFARILIYLEQHPIEPEPPLLTKMKQSLTKSINRLHELEQDQHAANQGLSGAAVRAKRQHMRQQQLMPLVRITKPLLKFAPDTAHVLRVPHARADTATVASHALDVAKALTPHTKLLTSAGYAKDFIAQLTTEARELAALANAQDKARQRHSRATAAIRAEIKKAMGTVSVIEGIVMTRIHPRDRQMMELWRGARRVPARQGRPPQRGKRAVESPPPA